MESNKFKLNFQDNFMLASFFYVSFLVPQKKLPTNDVTVISSIIPIPSTL